MPFSEVLTSDCHQTTLALLFIAISISLGIYMHLPHLLKILSPGSLLLSSDIIFGDLNISVNYSSDTLTSQFINLFSSTFSQLPTPIQYSGFVITSTWIPSMISLSKILFSNHLLTSGIPTPGTLRPHKINSPLNHLPFQYSSPILCSNFSPHLVFITWSKITTIPSHSQHPPLLSFPIVLPWHSPKPS